MPRNGSGGYALDPSTWNPGVDGVTATTSDWNVKVKADLETAIAGSVAADGQTPMSDSLNMASHKVINLADGTADDDAMNFGQTKMPAFSAYTLASQSVPHATATKVSFNTENFDTNSCYDNATNYRFTPNVAGYYNVSALVPMNFVTGTGYLEVYVYKNGSLIRSGKSVTGGDVAISGAVSALVAMNGTTDYLECYVYQSNSSVAARSIANGTNVSNFSASYVRPL